MKKTYALILSFSSMATLAFPQADLAITAASFQPGFVDRGEIFRVEATVANLGNATAAANYLFIYYSQDLAVSDDEIISRVSVKELAPNESQDVVFLYPVSPSSSPGNYYIGFEADPFDDVPESDESNLFCASNASGCVRFNISGAVRNYQKFTYPILFVHGWTADSRTWDAFTGEAVSYYGWSYGGRLDYCLNPDGNQSTSDGYYQSFVNTSNLGVGDYYTVNFDISADGVLFVGNDGIPFNDDHSNQAAIVKQGWAVGDAIETVLDLTGAEKVILAGHSMGGLANREYLQNPENWQVNGELETWKQDIIERENFLEKKRGDLNQHARQRLIELKEIWRHWEQMTPVLKSEWRKLGEKKGYWSSVLDGKREKLTSLQEENRLLSMILIEEEMNRQNQLQSLRTELEERLKKQEEEWKANIERKRKAYRESLKRLEDELLKQLRIEIAKENPKSSEELRKQLIKGNFSYLSAKEKVVSDHSKKLNNYLIRELTKIGYSWEEFVEEMESNKDES